MAADAKQLFQPSYIRNWLTDLTNQTNQKQFSESQAKETLSSTTAVQYAFHVSFTLSNELMIKVELPP